ncbi:Rho termination factor N-terminal domain-containing protein, partial [Arthrobacter sp. H14]|uniref:Rho termination factor N-terminal domain-containing protein n=1 Tax=Arthrobacter sp. H14 TaxID=1312959 RepID=UPI0015644F51
MTETTDLSTAGVDKDTAPAEGNKSNGLAGLKLAQLQALAGQLGITGGSRMRKGDLVTAISNHQRGGAVADREAKPAKSGAAANGTSESNGTADSNGSQGGSPAAAPQAAEDQTAAKADRDKSGKGPDQQGGSESSDGGQRAPRTRNRNRRAGSDGLVATGSEQSSEQDTSRTEAPAAPKSAPSEGDRNDGGNRR